MSAFRQFTLSKGKSAGRNSAGRITIFHRGGGAKRLQRIVDLKRTNSSTGIVESIEYDPNRSSRIALVRWTQGVRLGPRRKFEKLEEFNTPEKFLEPITAAIRSPFSFTSLPGTVYQKKMMSNGTSPKDVFLSAFSSSKAKGETASLSLDTFGFPRIAVAGAKPAFFVPRMKEEVGGQNSFSLSEIRQSKPDSILWAHRIKRKAAVSWQSLGQQKSLGFGIALDHNELKQKDRTCKVNHAPAV